MDYGFVFDGTFNLSWAQQRELVKLAADARLPAHPARSPRRGGGQLLGQGLEPARRAPRIQATQGADQDADRARRTFAESLLRYGLVRPGADRDRGFRGHFARMGFDADLRRLETQRDTGTPIADLVDVVPVELMQQVGYFGRPEGAPEAFQRLARGLDTALLRMITTEPGPEKVALALESVQPARIEDRLGARGR